MTGTFISVPFPYDNNRESRKVRAVAVLYERPLTIRDLFSRACRSARRGRYLRAVVWRDPAGDDEMQ